MWDLIHDRTHMRGDLPFDPFMIKQRMPFFLYSLEELRCDLTAFRESVKIERDEKASPESREAREARAVRRDLRPHLPVPDHRQPGAQLRRPRRPAAVRVDAPAPRAALDRHEAHHRLGRGSGCRRRARRPINDLYWQSIDRPKKAHWLAAYELVAETLTPNPASAWARGLPHEVLAGPPKGYTDAVLDDEFPLSMFFEALDKKMKPVIESTVGITADA